MRRRLLACGIILCAASTQSGMAQELPPLLPPEEAAAMMGGRTLRAFRVDGAGFYGMESFLGGQEVVWQDAERCTTGRWTVRDDDLCFHYDYKPADAPQICWRFHLEADGVIGAYREGDPTRSHLRMVDMGDPPLSCQDWLGS